MDKKESVVVDTTAEKIEGLRIRFVLGRGLVADSFPPRIALTPESMILGEQHKGVMWLEGNGGIGSKMTFSLTNGEAVYEIVDRGLLQNGDTIFVADRKAFKPKIGGKAVEVKTYGLNNIYKLSDEWPALAAFRVELFNPPEKLKKHLRVQNKGEHARLVFSFPGEKAVYTVFARHPGEKGIVYIAERLTLKTSTQSWTRIPTAHSRGGVSIF